MFTPGPLSVEERQVDALARAEQRARCSSRPGSPSAHRSSCRAGVPSGSVTVTTPLAENVTVIDRFAVLAPCAAGVSPSSATATALAAVRRSALDHSRLNLLGRGGPTGPANCVRPGDDIALDTPISAPDRIYLTQQIEPRFRRRLNRRVVRCSP